MLVNDCMIVDISIYMFVCPHLCIYVYIYTYCICPYRGRAQIETGARIVAGGQEASSLIEAGSK